MPLDAWTEADKGAQNKHIASSAYFVGGGCLKSKPTPGRHLKFCQKHISSQNHICQMAKFGEDILHHSQAIASERFSARQFWPWTLTLTSHKLITTFRTDAKHPCQISWKVRLLLVKKSLPTPCQRLTNEQINELTNKHDGLQYLRPPSTGNNSNTQKDICQQRRSRNNKPWHFWGSRWWNAVTAGYVAAESCDKQDTSSNVQDSKELAMDAAGLSLQTSPPAASYHSAVLHTMLWINHMQMLSLAHSIRQHRPV